MWKLLANILPLAVPEQIGMEPGETPQAQQYGFGTATAIEPQRTEDDEFGNLLLLRITGVSS